jgi:hypothetical protein
MSVSWEEPVIIDLDNLGGRLKESLTLYARSSPYIIHSDITVMPEVRNLLFCESSFVGTVVHQEVAFILEQTVSAT